MILCNVNSVIVATFKKENIVSTLVAFESDCDLVSAFEGD